MKNDIHAALDRLFRARHEIAQSLEDADHACRTWLDDELDALAAATGFDRAGAVERWERELEAEAAELRAKYDAEAAELRARYEALPPAPKRHVGHTISEAVSTLVGKDARELWKDTER